MKKLRLHRPKERINKNYAYKIFIGDKKLAELKNGEAKVIEIPNESNNYELRAKIQWCGSERYNLSKLKNEDKLVISGSKFLNRKGIWIIALLPFIGALVFGYGRENIVIKYTGIGLFFSILIYIFWSFVIAKNKWIRIEKTNTHATRNNRK